MRVLIVDDSKTMRSLLRRYLADLATEVIEAENGRDGLAALRAASEPLDLVVADMHMPQMDGRELVEAVRADERWADVSLLMVSTESDLPEIQRALEAGANEYMMKPFQKAALLDKLRVLGLLKD